MVGIENSIRKVNLYIKDIYSMYKDKPFFEINKKIYATIYSGELKGISTSGRYHFKDDKGVVHGHFLLDKFTNTTI